MAEAYLYPNGVGYITECSKVIPEGAAHWSTVDDPAGMQDGLTSYIQNLIPGEEYQVFLDGFTTTKPTNLSRMVISSLYLYGYGSGYGSQIQNPALDITFSVYVRTHSTNYGVTAIMPNGATGKLVWKEISRTFTNNPYTGQAWTPSEINDLQLVGGVETMDRKSGATLTQVYAKITYELMPSSGGASLLI